MVLVVETVLSIADPGRPACVFPGNRLRVIESYDDQCGFNLLERSLVGRGSSDQVFASLKNSQ